MKSKVTYRPHRVVSLNGRIFAQLYDGPFDVAENFARLNWGLDVHLTNWSVLSDTVRAEALKSPEFSRLLPVRCRSMPTSWSNGHPDPSSTLRNSRPRRTVHRRVARKSARSGSRPDAGGR